MWQNIWHTIFIPRKKNFFKLKLEKNLHKFSLIETMEDDIDLERLPIEEVVDYIDVAIDISRYRMHILVEDIGKLFFLTFSMQICVNNDNGGLLDIIPRYFRDEIPSFCNDRL